MNRRLQRSLQYAVKRRLARITGTPAVTEAPAIAGTEQVGQTLSCSEGAWTNTPIAFRYEWRRDGAVIDGAEASDYELVAEDEDAIINCTVRAVNRNGTAGATTEAVGPIAAA